MKESIFFDVWHTTYDYFPKACNTTDTHINYTGWARETEGNLLYVQLLNLQYFLAVAFKSTNCHADSSIYWHSLYEDILSACNGPVIVLRRRLPTWVLDTLGTKRMAMTLDFSPPCKHETLKKESERRSSDKAPVCHLLGVLCGELLISKALWMTWWWKMSKGWWRDLLTWGRLVTRPGRRDSQNAVLQGQPRGGTSAYEGDWSFSVRVT